MADDPAIVDDAGAPVASYPVPQQRRQQIESATQRYAPDLFGQTASGLPIPANMGRMLLGSPYGELPRKTEKTPQQQYEERTRTIANLSQKQEPREAELTAKAIEDQMRNLRQKVEGQQAQIKEVPSFKIPEQDALSLMGLFVGLPIMAMMSGGKRAIGQAQSAQAAMTGMLKGYQEGDKAAFEKAKTVYDSNVNAIKAHNERIKAIIETELRLAPGDLQAATARAAAKAKAEGAPLTAEIILRDGIVKASDLTRHIGEQTIKLRENELKLKKMEAEIEATRALTESRRVAADMRAGKENKEVIGAVSAATGAVLPSKEATEVASGANAIAESYAIANIVAKKPTIVGRPGQFQQFVDRYIASFKLIPKEAVSAQGEGLTEQERQTVPATEQEALLLAKRYAAYLVNYERSLAGGARGFTVAFQKRFNTLMAQEQFNAEGFIELLKDQAREVSQNTVAKAPTKLNIDNLARLGITIAQASGDSNAAEGYERFRGSVQAPAPGGAAAPPSTPEQPSSLTGRNLQWSPSLKRWRDKETNEIFDETGAKVQ